MLDLDDTLEGTGPCLDNEAVIRLARGAVSEDERRQWVQHVESCSGCLQLLGRAAAQVSNTPVTGDDDTLQGEPNSDTEGRARLGLLEAGDALGRYSILSMLGHGGMGVVYAAYDPELDRRVALKLLLPQGVPSKDGSVRLLREAQAMAKLAHPNIVAVHDVGSVQGLVYVAMEFVKGTTLRGWLDAEPRTQRQILDALIAAGEGLIAAHDKGLVHRDFKFDNVMVGDDGRVRVMDFGLVRSVGTQPDLDTTLPVDDGVATREQPLDANLTQTGAMLGTPRYMAPEQFRGEAVGARTDQFSFCVVMWEALHGTRCFGGKTLASLAANVVAGRREPAPKSVKVPARIRAALDRGLSTDPSQRWPDMATLLGELQLEARPGRARTQLVAAVGFAVAAAAGTTAWMMSGRQPEPCESAGAPVAEVWTRSAAATARDAFGATGLRYADEVWRRTEQSLSERALAWEAAYVDTCEASRVDQTQSTDLMDRRSACLDRQMQSLSALLDVFGRADATIVDNAARAVEGLPDPDRCSAAATLDRAEPQADSQIVRSVRERVATAEALSTAGKYTAAIDAGAQAVALARDAGDDVLLAEALLVHIEAKEADGQDLPSDEMLEEALLVARRTGDDGLTVDALSSRVRVLIEADRHADALRWVERARAEVQRTDDALWQTRLEAQAALAQSGLGHYAEAAAAYRRAIEGYRALGKTNSSFLLNALSNLSSALVYDGRAKEALPYANEALDMAREIYGESHPTYAAVLYNTANMLAAIGDLDEARRRYEEALTLRREIFGPRHKEVALNLIGLGSLLVGIGEAERGIEVHEEAIEILVPLVGEDHHWVAMAYNNISGAHTITGNLDAALAAARKAYEIKSRLFDSNHPDLAISHTNLGDILMMAGRYPEALEHRKVALAIRQKNTNAEATADAQARLALTLAATGDFTDVDALVGDALAVAPNAAAVGAQALAAAHRGDHGRARELAESLREEEGVAALETLMAPLLAPP